MTPITPADGAHSDSAASEYDSVTQDAITQGVPIPPAQPQDQRRAYLGGEFAADRGDANPSNPYRDPGCAEAWLAGFQRMRRESRES